MWRHAHALLRERAGGAVELVRAAAGLDIPALPFAPNDVRAIVTTGVGSSAAHAALLAHLLSVELGLPARCVPTGAFVAPPTGPRRDALIVFSQGLSPNARLSLATPAAWRGIVLVTGVTARDRAAGAARRATLAALHRAGALCITQPGGTEYGTLLRLGGPLVGYAIAYRLAAAIGRAAGLAIHHLDLDANGIAARMRVAARRAAALAVHGDPFADPVVLLASGGYGELASNLTLKLSEGLLEPRPPVVDLIGFAHGPYQELRQRSATLVMLQRPGAPLEARLLTRLRSMLDRRRHRLLLLPAHLPGARALFEHEASLNELVLRSIAARRIDQARWPGRGTDRPLYDIAHPARTAGNARRPPAARAWNAAGPSGVSAGTAGGPPAAGARRKSTRTSTHAKVDTHHRALDALTWPQLDELLRAGCRTAVLPLGATEQHGPHLPFATDTWIADALAERFCARVAEAVRLPALALGCSAEHAAFPGTLSLRTTTLRAVLGDAVRSLAGHGFARVFIFSAHGGNDTALRRALPALRSAARPARLIAFTGIAQLTALWHATSAAAGISAHAAGHHAGEFETSIMLALRPDSVRREQVAAGLLDPGADPQAVFYPSLRAHSPSGVVGDPRPAAAARAERYLAAWVDALVACYRRGAKNAKKTSGTQRA